MKKADIILKSKTIFDAVGDLPFEGFIAIRGNRIAAVEKGSSGMEEWKAEETELIDCGEGLVMPGMIDAHMHFFDGVFQNSKYMCRELFQCKSARECAAEIGRFAKAHPEYETITGMGWFIPAWDNPESPDKKMLDEVEAERPVYLMCADGHSFWLNSRALEDCGIQANQELLFGSIELNEAGEPNGVLHELDACAICTVKAQKLPKQQKEDLITDFINSLSRCGITTATDITVLPKPIPVTDELRIVKHLEEENRLNIRLNLYPSLGVTDDFRLVQEYRRQFDSDLLRVAGLKAFVDGVHGNNTALLLDPYVDEPGSIGASFYPYETYEKLVTAANREGFGVKLHCTGEGATNLALRAYEHAAQHNFVRNSIEHVETIRAADLKRFHDLNITASMQPSHLMYGGDTLRKKLGDERVKLQYALKSMIQSGVNVAFSSDYPVAPFEPMLNVYFAVTRCDLEGNPVGKEREQRITLAEALKAYTAGGAYCLNLEQKVGTLEAGKYADITVFDQNLFAMTPKELLKAETALTVSNGRIVYRKQEKA